MWCYGKWEKGKERSHNAHKCQILAIQVWCLSTDNNYNPPKHQPHLWFSQLPIMHIMLNCTLGSLWNLRMAIDINSARGMFLSSPWAFALHCHSLASCDWLSSHHLAALLNSPNTDAVNRQEGWADGCMLLQREIWEKQHHHSKKQTNKDEFSVCLYNFLETVSFIRRNIFKLVRLK